MTTAPVKLSPEQIKARVAEVAKAYFLDCPQADGDERRQTPRHQLTIPVLLQPLEESGTHLSHKHQAISRDISYRGIGLVTANPVRPGDYRLTIQPFSSEEFDVAARVSYCNGVGYYYEVGFEFILGE